MSGTSDTGVAILGSGTLVKQAYLPALKVLGPLAPALKAVYSRSENTARELADDAAKHLPSRPDIYHDRDLLMSLEALLARSDISTVIVALPIPLQPQIVIQALAFGKHVISEKPVAPDVASGLKLIATYEADYKPKGLIWRIGENWEAEPAYIAAGQAIRTGKIGKVMFFSWRGVHRVGKDATAEYPGGIMLDQGVHSAAALRVVLPSPLASLSGFASSNMAWLTPHDTAHAVLKCADGSQGTFELSIAAPTQSRTAGNGIVVTGTEGYLSVHQTKIKDPITGESKPVFRIVVKSITRDADGNAGREREEMMDEPIRGVELELASFFAAALEGKVDGLGCPRNALLDLAFIEAVLKSGGELIDLEKLVTSV